MAMCRILTVLGSALFVAALFGVSRRWGHGADQASGTANEPASPRDQSTTRAEDECPQVQTQADFKLTTFISKRWYAQKQMVVDYLPEDSFNCVTAMYTPREPQFPWWSYSINVENRATKDDGERMDADLCATGADDADAAKLKVAPCFLPSVVAGPYWVLAHNEEEGYALISGGQPTIKTDSGCKTGSGTNGSGLWIFTREAFPSAALVQKVIDIAESQGFDVSVLRKVAHTNCTGEGYATQVLV